MCHDLLTYRLHIQRQSYIGGDWVLQNSRVVARWWCACERRAALQCSKWCYSERAQVPRGVGRALSRLTQCRPRSTFKYAAWCRSRTHHASHLHRRRNPLTYLIFSAKANQPHAYREGSATRTTKIKRSLTIYDPCAPINCLETRLNLSQPLKGSHKVRT